MTWRTSIASLILAVILSAVAVVMQRGADTGDLTFGPGPLRETERFPIGELDRIELQRGESSWIFVREGSRWWQISPFRAPIEGHHLMALAEQALALRVLDRFDSDEDLSLEDLHLVTPEARLTLGWPGSQRQFELGRRGVAGQGYLRVDDHPDVLVVNQGLHRLVMDTDPTIWREPRLFPGIDIEAKRIGRLVGEELTVLQRTGRSWRFSEPVSTRTDKAAMEAYIIELARARSNSVILDQPEHLDAFGLTTPLATLIVVDHADVERRLIVGDRVGGQTQDRYVMIEGIPSVLRADGDMLAMLLVDPMTLVDPRGSGVPASSVKAIEIHGPEDDIRLERDLDRWVARSHGDAEVPRDRVEALLDRLTKIPASTIALVDPYPAALEQGTITLIGYDQRPIDTVRLLLETEADGGRWGLENGDRIIRIHDDLINLPLHAADWGLTSPASSPGQ